LPDKLVQVNGRMERAVDLWIYAADAEDADAELSFRISNKPDTSCGVGIDANHFINIRPAIGWTGSTEVEVEVRESGGLSASDAFMAKVAPWTASWAAYLPLTMRRTGPP
jgi:hypothetical protein